MSFSISFSAYFTRSWWHALDWMLYNFCGQDSGLLSDFSELMISSALFFFLKFPVNHFSEYEYISNLFNMVVVL